MLASTPSPTATARKANGWRPTVRPASRPSSAVLSHARSAMAYASFMPSFIQRERDDDGHQLEEELEGHQLERLDVDGHQLELLEPMESWSRDIHPSRRLPDQRSESRSMRPMELPDPYRCDASSVRDRIRCSASRTMRSISLAVSLRYPNIPISFESSPDGLIGLGPRARGPFGSPARGCGVAVERPVSSGGSGRKKEAGRGPASGVKTTMQPEGNGCMRWFNALSFLRFHSLACELPE